MFVLKFNTDKQSKNGQSINRTHYYNMKKKKTKKERLGARARDSERDA